MIRRLLVPALLVYSVILLRAANQSVTLDEADSFNNFANENVFYASSGNHVLNSLLALYSTQLFGLSQFTFRIPALAGAAIYLLAVLFITARLTRDNPGVRLLGFAILTLNPFVLDYLIAARGYALALGFLAAAVAMAMRILEDKPPIGRAVCDSAVLSLCCALAVSANFSFSFAVLCSIAAFLLTLILSRTAFTRWIAIAAATILPGALAGFALVGRTLRDYPRSQLYYGASTWDEMWTEMLEAVFPRQNLSLQLVNLEPVLTAAHHAATYLSLVPMAIALWAAFAVKSWTARFVWLALTLTLTAHGLAHSFQGLLLPLDRTGLFIAFFLSLVAVYGAAAAPSAIGRYAATAVLCGSLLIFALALRTNYFRIWDFDLDVDRGFGAVAQYAKDHPIESAGCTWRYAGAYNFYRLATHSESLPPCEHIDQDNPPPRSVYFLQVPVKPNSLPRPSSPSFTRAPSAVW